jgi:hypothetical protein
VRFGYDKVGSCLHTEVTEDDVGISGKIYPNEKSRIVFGCDGALSIVQLCRIVVLLVKLSKI